MGNNKHTEGPWIVLQNQDTAPIFVYAKYNYSANPTPICKIIKDQRENVDPVSNANLIAAAPEMLEMMIMMLDRLEDKKVAALWESPEEHEIEMDIYRKVISKAKGESF